jgi:hypothetical protein
MDFQNKTIIVIDHGAACETTVITVIVDSHIMLLEIKLPRMIFHSYTVAYNHHHHNNSSDIKVDQRISHWFCKSI